MKRIAENSDASKRRPVSSPGYTATSQLAKFKPVDFWPYEDFSTMWLHILFMLAPNVSNRWKSWVMDLIRQPQFCAADIRIKTAHALHAKYDCFYEAGLEENVVQATVHEVRKPKIVPYSSIIEANRLLWSSPVHSKYLTPSQDASVRSEVSSDHELQVQPQTTLFNCTPLAHFPVKFSRLCSFNVLGHEFRIGDFCRVKFKDDIGVCRIDKLQYKRWDHYDKDHPYPYLEICYTQCQKARNIYSRKARKVLKNEYFLEARSEATSTIDEVIGTFSMRVTESADVPTDWPSSGEEGIIRYSRIPIGSRGQRKFRYEQYRHPLHQFDYEEDGKRTTYISLFVDGFTSGSQKQSSTGVYMNWLNAQGHVRHREAFIHTLMLVPPCVDQYDALSPLRRDVKLMENGIQLYSHHHRATVVLQLYIALLSLDLMGAYPLLRHGGNRCEMNCCNCMIRKDGRLDFRTPLQTPRRLQLTDLCIEQVQDVVIEMVDTRVKKNQNTTLPQQTQQRVRSSYGVLQSKNPFEGLTLDPHAQYFRCTSHMILFGLFKHLYRTLWEQWLTPLMRKALEASLSTVHDPQNLAARLKEQGRDGSSSTLSMEEVRGLSMLLTSCFDGLLKADLLKHFRQLWRVYTRSTGRSLLTTAELKEVQQLGVKVVKYGFKVLPDVWNVPNGHGFIHYLQITLPALLNGRFSCSSMFEKTHGLAKQVNRITGRQSYEVTAMRRIHRKRTLRLAASGSKLDASGTTFGKAVSHYLFAGPYCPRPPSFCNEIAPLRMQPYLVAQYRHYLKVSPTKWAGPWRTKSVGRRHPGITLFRTGLIERVKQSYDCKQMSDDQVNDEIVDIRTHESMFRITHVGKTFLVREGDVMKALWRGEDWSTPPSQSVYKVQAIISFSFRGKRHLAVLPIWFAADTTLTSSRSSSSSSSSGSQELPRREDGALLLEVMPRRDDVGDLVVYDVERPKDIIEKVLTIHRCSYVGSKPCKFFCPHGKEVSVYIKLYIGKGRQGPAWKCPTGKACNIKQSGFILRKKCNPENTKYAAYDTRAGFKMHLRYTTASDIPKCGR